MTKEELVNLKGLCRLSLGWGSLILLVLGLVKPSMASPLLENMRRDRTVPEHCRQTHLEDFFVNDQLFFFTYSSRGGKKRGYTYEYPLHRDDVDRLHHLVQRQKQNGRPDQNTLKDPQMVKAWDEVVVNYEPMGFPLINLGETMEILAIVDLVNAFEESDYFITGSVGYQYRGKGGLQGELDVVIARRSDCRVEAIGEVKMGIHRLGKAKQQLRRFQQFLSRVRPKRGKNFLVEIFDVPSSLQSW